MMKTSFTKPVLIAALSLVGVVATNAHAFANNALGAEVTQIVELKNGSSVYIFQDGKMAMESKTGRVTRMNPGETMEAKDGRKIVMHGDEVARLDSLKYIPN
jgi:hypothetical protein